MSSKKVNEGIPTNEEVVDELLKDLEKSDLDDEEYNELNQPLDIDPKEAVFNVDFNDSATKEPVKNGEDPVPSDFEKSDSEKDENEKVDDDFIDETALKDLEQSLTPEELQTKHEDALKLKKEGNEQFNSQLYVESVQTYTKALRICPLEYKNDRSILYANRAASKLKVKREQSAIEDCCKAIELNPNYVRAYLRRAKLYEDTEKLDESLEDYKKILEIDPGNKEAMTASVRLPPLINERNEKLKTEMMGKLKDLGDMILRPFGLSTENFKLQQDPNSGGYSINFQQSARK